MRRQPRWMQALGNTRNGLFVVDGSQRILAWNSAAERLLGYAAAEMVGRRCYDVVTGRLPSGKLWCRPDCGVQRRVKQGTLPPNVDLAVRTKDQRTVWLDVACTVLPRKPAPLVAHLLRDVTDVKLEARELDDIRAILGAAADPRRPGGTKRPGDPRRRAKTAPNARTVDGGEPAARLSTLTARERAVLSFLADGLSSRAIAERLDISLLTVRSHVANLLHKLGVHRQAAAVAVALRDEA